MCVGVCVRVCVGMWMKLEIFSLQANWQSIMSNLDSNNAMAPVAKVGHYNDPDMLQVHHDMVHSCHTQYHFVPDTK